MKISAKNLLTFKIYSFILQKKNYIIMSVGLLLIFLFWLLQIFTPWINPWTDTHNPNTNLMSLTGPFINLICSAFFIIGLYILLLSLFKIRIWNRNNKNLLLLSNNISKRNILYSEMFISLILFFGFLIVFVFLMPALILAKWVGEKDTTINLYFTTQYLYIYLAVVLMLDFGIFFIMSGVLNISKNYNNFKIILISVPIVLYFIITILNSADSGKLALFQISVDQQGNFQITNWVNTYVYLGVSAIIFVISGPGFIITNNYYVKKVDWI